MFFDAATTAVGVLLSATSIANEGPATITKLSSVIVSNSDMNSSLMSFPEATSIPFDTFTTIFFVKSTSLILSK